MDKLYRSKTKHWHSDLSAQRFLPMVILMAVIFTLSNQPGDSIQLPDVVNIDKLCHALEYAALGAACLYGLHPTRRTLAPILIVLIAVILCTAYGVTDEVHQMFVRGRDSSIADVGADFFGALVVSLLWWTFFSPVNRNNFTNKFQKGGL
jgi:VanZ family protein